MIRAGLVLHRTVRVWRQRKGTWGMRWRNLKCVSCANCRTMASWRKRTHLFKSKCLCSRKTRSVITYVYILCCVYIRGGGVKFGHNFDFSRSLKKHRNQRQKMNLLNGVVCDWMLQHCESNPSAPVDCSRCVMCTCILVCLPWAGFNVFGDTPVKVYHKTKCSTK